jgi:hypothetical protein
MSGIYAIVSPSENFYTCRAARKREKRNLRKVAD